MTDEPMEDQAGPHDSEAENAVVGGMLLSGAAVDDVVNILTGAEFYDTRLTVVFDAVVALHSAGKKADAVLVADYLNKTRDLPRVGGQAFLHTLISSVPSFANAGYYAEIVADLATQRSVIAAGTRIMQLGYRGAENRAALVAAVDTEVASVIDGIPTGQDTMTPLIELVEQVINKASNPLPGQQGIGTGYLDVDHILGGFLPGQMVVVAGRPGTGKSCMAADIARAAAKKKHKVLVVTLEMGREEYTARLLASEAGVNLTSIRTGGDALDEQWDWPRLTAAALRLSEMNEHLIIEEPPAMGLAGLGALIRRHKPDIVLYDYLQLSTMAGEDAGNRQVVVSTFSRGVKLLAKASGIPIVMLSQLNRKSSDRSDGRPHLSDLRESGSIEQDADIVILLHRPELHTPDDPQLAGLAYAIIAKNRNGPTQDVELLFQGQYVRYANAHKEPMQQPEAYAA
jgi:replicative DNA helicase